MSCVLRTTGSQFALDEFLTNSSLKPIAVFRKGESSSGVSRRVTRKADASGFNVVVSEADFSQVQSQIADAIIFLEQNRPELARLTQLAGVERVSLDFGIEERDAAAQSEHFPPELLRALGELGIWLEFTLYPGQEARGPDGKSPARGS